MKKLNKILEIKFGSHLYGTSTENSDTDIKAIYLPTAKEIVLGTYKKTITTVRPKAVGERNKKDDVDIEIFSLDRFVDLLLQGQTVALDILFAPDNMYIDENTTTMGAYVMNVLRENRHELLNRNVNAFVGYAKQQAAKYGQKGFRIHAIQSTVEFLRPRENFMTLAVFGAAHVQNWINENKNEHIKITMLKGPNDSDLAHLEVSGKYYPFTQKISDIVKQLTKRYEEYGSRAILAQKNEGIDWKALSHAVRVNREAQELLSTSHITFPRPEAQLLLDIKVGKIPYAEVADMITDGLDRLKELQHTSTLKDEPNKAWADDFIWKIYSGIVKQEKHPNGGYDETQ